MLQGGWGYSLRGIDCVAPDEVLEHIMQRVSCLVLYTLGGGFEDWAFTDGTYTKEYFLHVTTENFTDVHGYVRRPMLARPSLPLDARRFAELVDRQPGPVLAFCRTGNRCGKLWERARQLRE